MTMADRAIVMCLMLALARELVAPYCSRNMIPMASFGLGIGFR